MILNIFFYLLLPYIFLVAYFRFRPNPYTANVKLENFWVDDKNVKFVYDLFWFEQEEMKSDYNILKTILSSIKNAKNFILIDIFLFNKKEASDKKHLPTTSMVVDALGKRDIPKVFITDPINTTYFSEESRSINDLRSAGVRVAFTDLKKLPDNNLIYSTFWRLFISWFGTKGKKTVPNPLDPNRKTTIRAILEAANARANHKKLVITDNLSLVFSGNLHNASSFFSNTAVQVKSSLVAKKFLDIEMELLKVVDRLDYLEGVKIDKSEEDKAGKAMVTPLVGGHIKDVILEDFKNLKKGDKVTIGMLFISDRKIISILKKKARQEGVEIDLILDKNKVSFNTEKIGFPNRFVVPELVDSGIRTYWYKNDQDEFHSKFICIEKKDRVIFNTGSANLTRRSLLGTNLEDNIRIEMPKQKKFSNDVVDYCLKIKTPKLASLAKSKPRYYILGYLWMRFAEKTGLAAW